MMVTIATDNILEKHDIFTDDKLLSAKTLLPAKTPLYIHARDSGKERNK